MPDDTEIVIGHPNVIEMARHIGKDDVTFVKQPKITCKREIRGGEEIVFGYYMVISDDLYNQLQNL